MSGTSKAVLSMCVLLLASLVVYYGMTPPEASQAGTHDLPKQRPSLFGGDPEEKMIALGFPPIATSMPETNVNESVLPENSLFTVSVPRPTVRLDPILDAEPVVVELPIAEIVQVHTPEPKIVLPKKVVIVDETYKIYIVKDHETLGEIASRELGSFQMWREIAKTNNITDPSRVMPGRVLRMPSSKLAKPKKSKVPKAALPKGSQVHIVVNGDTMSSIADEYYDDKNKYGVIANANPKVDPNRLKIGTALVIPKL